jgi:hypothetical protein
MSLTENINMPSEHSDDTDATIYGMTHKPKMDTVTLFNVSDSALNCVVYLTTH